MINNREDIIASIKRERTSSDVWHVKLCSKFIFSAQLVSLENDRSPRRRASVRRIKIHESLNERGNDTHVKSIWPLFTMQRICFHATCIDRVHKGQFVVDQETSVSMRFRSEKLRYSMEKDIFHGYLSPHFTLCFHDVRILCACFCNAFSWS